MSIGIVPAGTANLLARNLEVPLDLNGAVDIALHGPPRELDVGKMNGQTFAVMGGTGFDALMIKDVEDHRLKERFGRLGYVGATVRGTGVEPADVRIRIDGSPWFSGDATCVIVANVGTLLGGIEAFRDATPDDGRLDVGVVQARSRREWARLGARAITGRADLSPFVITTTCHEMELTVDRKWPWQVDGGDRRATKNSRWEVLPAAVRICRPIVPADQNGRD